MEGRILTEYVSWVSWDTGKLVATLQPHSPLATTTQYVHVLDDADADIFGTTTHNRLIDDR